MAVVLAVARGCYMLREARGGDEKGFNAVPWFLGNLLL